MAALVITSTVNETTAPVVLVAASRVLALSGDLAGARIKAQISDAGAAWSDFVFFDGNFARVWLTKQCALALSLPIGWQIRIVQERVTTTASAARVAIE